MTPNRSMSPLSVEITGSAAGSIVVRGALTFETARRAHEAGLELIAASDAPEIEVDCAAVSDSDSAGLAVLLDWLAIVRRDNRQIRFTHLPDKLCAVARISEIEGLLGV